LPHVVAPVPPYDRSRPRVRRRIRWWLPPDAIADDPVDPGWSPRAQREFFGVSPDRPPDASRSERVGGGTAPPFHRSRSAWRRWPAKGHRFPSAYPTRFRRQGGFRGATSRRFPPPRTAEFESHSEDRANDSRRPAPGVPSVEATVSYLVCPR